MDDSQNKQPVTSQDGVQTATFGQNQTSVQQSAASSQPVQQPVHTPMQQPVGSINKEHGPIVAEVGNVSEYLKPSEVAPTVEASVKEAGVEVRQEVPELTLADKRAGIALAKEAAPVPLEPSGLVNLPLTPQQALQTVKKDKNTQNGIFALATLILKLLKKDQVQEHDLDTSNVTL